ncbi:hypothetical protein Tco_1034687 [Tanacetum coccineum]
MLGRGRVPLCVVEAIWGTPIPVSVWLLDRRGTLILVCVRSCPNIVLQLVGPLGFVNEEIVRHDIVGDEIVDDGVPKERVKRTSIPHIKITDKRRLYRLLDEDEDDGDIYGHV